MKRSTTGRGFDIINFEDFYGSLCSIQKSSIATEDCIWLGIDDPNPQILASKTQQGGTGWVKYSIPEDVSINTRMHLTREQAKDIVKALKVFIKTGDL